MKIEYKCSDCEKVKLNKNMRSMLCACGGSFKLLKEPHIKPAFEPYYDRVLEAHVSSYSDREKKMNKLSNYSHPKGVVSVRDNKKFMREMAYIQKHREEYKEKIMPGYKARTEREIEKQGERRYDPNSPNIRSRRIFSFAR
jgi:hypothetical protein